MTGESNQLFFNTPPSRAYASAGPALLTIYAQWTVIIKASVALKYANEFDSFSNSGFSKHGDGILLTHQDAKLVLDGQEANAIVELILNSYGPNGRFPQ